MAVTFDLSNSRVVAEATPSGDLAARIERECIVEYGILAEGTADALANLARWG